MGSMATEMHPIRTHPQATGNASGPLACRFWNMARATRGRAPPIIDRKTTACNLTSQRSCRFHHRNLGSEGRLTVVSGVYTGNVVRVAVTEVTETSVEETESADAEETTEDDGDDPVN